jgi:Flp pilus assembly protein TadD
VFGCLLLAGQPQRTVQEQEPPEEDPSVTEKQQYTFNPLQSAKELRVGSFYYKKGSYRAAARRFEEATRWDPNNTEAWFKLGEAQAKLGDDKAARGAWEKVIELDPDSKQAAELRKKLAKR